jgi:hypothetical protein
MISTNIEWAFLGGVIIITIVTIIVVSKIRK